MFLTDNYNIDVQYLSKNLSDNKHLVINIGPNITGVIIISPPELSYTNVCSNAFSCLGQEMGLNAIFSVKFVYRTFAYIYMNSDLQFSEYSRIPRSPCNMDVLFFTVRFSCHCCILCHFVWKKSTISIMTPFLSCY